MDTVKISEGQIKLLIPNTKKSALKASSPAFYNPVMVVNRDISVLICKLLKPKSALDLLSATGVRALRLKKETGIKEVWANDAKKSAFEFIRKNAKLNKLSIHISNMYASDLLAKSHKFDYIDVDPFGTPVPFVDDAVKKLNKNGILAVTATDTAVLCGSAPFKVCIGRYGGKPIRNYLMHEVGLRILIKYVIETGLKHKINLIPIFSNSTRHYMRIYFKTTKTNVKKHKPNKVRLCPSEISFRLGSIGVWQDAGPMWLGDLWDDELVDDMHSLAMKDKNISKDTKELLFTIKEESKIHKIGFIDIAEFKPKNFPKINDVIASLQGKGFKAARTHFNPTGIRTNASKNILKKQVKFI